MNGVTKRLSDAEPITYISERIFLRNNFLIEFNYEDNAEDTIVGVPTENVSAMNECVKFTIA